MDKLYSVVDTETGRLISVSTSPPGITETRMITRLEFMRRLTDVELSTIYSISKTNIMIEVWLDKFRVAENINLEDPDTIEGLRQLEGAGILTQGRADEVLA